MKKTILVAVDFTPVSYNALKYACELSINQEIEIIAVHLIDENITGQFFAGKNLAVKKMAERMYQEILQKTKNDLQNFLSELRTSYKANLQPVISHGTIYEAFNEVASKYDSSLIIMGTHGIIGMQSVFGSRAYKVVAKTFHPFLIVQGNEYLPITKLYMVFKDAAQLNEYVNEVNEFCVYFKGEIIINLLQEVNKVSLNSLPMVLEYIQDRIQLIQEPLKNENVIEIALKHNANAIGICIDEMDNFSDETYGITQDKILANSYKMPVYCLPAKAML